MNTNMERVGRMQRGRMPVAAGSRWERGAEHLFVGVTDSRWAGGAGEASGPLSLSALCRDSEELSC